MSVETTVPLAPTGPRLVPEPAVNPMLIDAWSRLTARGSGWYWIVLGLRNGDLYHVCSLAKAFLNEHGRSHPIYLVTDAGSQANLAALYAEDFGDILLTIEFSPRSKEWMPFFKAFGLPYFGLDVPLFVHPQESLDTARFSIEFARENGLTWMQLYKRILHLPGDAEAVPPLVRPEVAARAAELCEREGVVAGRTVILFPYAQSLAVDALAHYAQLARDLNAEGFRVFTSVSREEVAVEGTKPIFIPFELLLDVADHAGWIVAVRSGICDITSSTRCRKTVIYPNVAELSGWGLAAMGLTQDAYEVLFDFRVGTPEQFSTLIRSDANYGELVTPPRRLSALVGEGRDDVRVATLSSVQLRRGASVPLWLTDPATPAGALIVTGMPSSDHPRLAPELAAARTRLVEQVGSQARFYVCRDQGILDHYEEIDTADLVSGRYSAGRGRHSVVVVAGTPIQSVLPDFARTRVLDLAEVRLGEWVLPGRYAGEGNDFAYGSSAKPLAVAGVQLVQGWSYPEDWGVWSDANRATLKLHFAEPPGQRAELVLVFNVAVSSFYPDVSFDVLVDGVPVRSCRFASPQELALPLGSAGAGTTVRVSFVFHDLKSPSEQGNGGDLRRLGIGLVRLGVREGPGGPLAEPAG